MQPPPKMPLASMIWSHGCTGSNDFNAATRRLKKICWMSFATPAISKLTKKTGPLGTEVQEGPTGRFHNSGGELVLLPPHLQAAGHHQDPQASGCRSVIIRFKGWSLHLITLYLDSNFDLESGPNEKRTMAVANLVRSIRLPWLILGDFNRPPVETAMSSWCAVTSPKVPFTCTNNSDESGTLIDYAMHSDDLTPYLDIEGVQDVAFKPHVISIKATIHREVSPDEAYIIDAPAEISQSFSPRNY